MNIISKEKEYVFQTYKRHELVVDKAKGKYVWDDDGERHLDFFTGISVANMGHCHPRIMAAIRKQCGKYMHVSNYYYAAPQVKLAEELVKKSFAGRVFLSNSGAEACECAIKLARKWGSASGGRYEIITFNNCFHGRTIATISATSQEKLKKGFEPWLEGFKYAEFNDIDSVKSAVTEKTVAVMLEPIQGEGGIHCATPGFMKSLRTLCDQKKLLLICDEIQCGLGRTGEMFAYESAGITPDIITVAKSLGGGLPLAATVAKDSVALALIAGEHGTTFGGNPVACAAAVEYLRLVTPKLLQKVKKTGRYFKWKLEALKTKFACIKEVRGEGLMLGVELDFNGADVVKFCQQKGLLINCTHDTVLRFLPPFIIDKEDVDTAVNILEEALKCQK
ncbi:MAG: aspartate aminotransferase family protein [Elusimicrobiota bacterium]